MRARLDTDSHQLRFIENPKAVAIEQPELHRPAVAAPRSDGRLPNLSHGLGLIETLAKMPSCEGTPIIVMTAHSATAELVEETRRCGARDFVPKPFPTTGHTLEEAIRLALQR